MFDLFEITVFLMSIQAFFYAKHPLGGEAGLTNLFR